MRICLAEITLSSLVLGVWPRAPDLLLGEPPAFPRDFPAWEDRVMAVHLLVGADHTKSSTLTWKRNETSQHGWLLKPSVRVGVGLWSHSRGISDGKAEAEGRSETGSRFHPDLSAVLFDNPLADG